MSSPVSSESVLHPRLILLHKQSTSGRVRYLRLPVGIALFEPLPELSALLDVDDAKSVVVPHPAALIQDAEHRLNLPPGSIEPAAEFCAWVDTPEGEVPVLLASFNSIDPPFDKAEALDGKFIAMTEARSLSLVERELLRRTYEFVLG